MGNSSCKTIWLLGAYLNLKPDIGIIKIDCETLKCEQRNDKIISPSCSLQNQPSCKDQKSMCWKSKCILNYCPYLKINNQGILVQQINNTEQIVQKYHKNIIM